MNPTTNKYIGAFATFGAPYGIQQGFLDGGHLHRTLDLSPSTIQISATGKLLRVLREVRDGKLYICYALYSYVREKNSNRAGTLIGNSILLENARIIDHASLWQILNDLHTQLISDTNNVSNQVLQAPEISKLRIYDEHALWNNLQVAKLNKLPIARIEKNKEIYVLRSAENSIEDFLKIATQPHYDVYESVYLPIEDANKELTEFVERKGLLATTTWKSFVTPPPPPSPPVFFSNILEKSNDYKPIFGSPEGIEVPFRTTIDFDIQTNNVTKKRPSDPWWVRYLQNDTSSNNQLVYYYCYYWNTETEKSIKGICIATYGGTGDTKYMYSLLSSMYNDIIAGNEAYKIPNNYQKFAKSCKSSGGNLSQLSKATWQVQDYESKIQDDNHEGRVTDFFNAINTRYSPCIVLKKNEPTITKLEIKPAIIDIEKDSSKQSKNSSKLVIGFIVIIVGGIFLLLHTEFKKQPVYTDETEPADTATTTNKYESKSNFIEKSKPTITQRAVDTTVINKGRKKIEIDLEEPENYQQKEIPPKTKPTTNTLRAVKEDTSFMRNMRKDVRALEKTSKTKDNSVFYDNSTIEKADIAMQNNDYYQAIRLYTNAIAIKDQPRQSSLYVKRANAYLKQQRYNQVVDDCNKAIAINYYNGEAYKLRGIAGYNILEGEYDETLSDDLTKAIEYTPNDPLLYYYKGNMFYNKGWKELAKKYLEKAASLGMEDAKVLLKKYYTK